MLFVQYLERASAGMFENYWFLPVVPPTFLAEMLKKTHYDLRELDEIGSDCCLHTLTDDRADVQPQRAR